MRSSNVQVIRGISCKMDSGVNPQHNAEIPSKIFFGLLRLFPRQIRVKLPYGRDFWVCCRLIRFHCDFSIRECLGFRKKGKLGTDSKMCGVVYRYVQKAEATGASENFPYTDSCFGRGLFHRLTTSASEKSEYRSTFPSFTVSVGLV